MKLDELSAAIAELAGPLEQTEQLHGQLAVHVTPDRWHDVCQVLRDHPKLAFNMVTFLTAVDEEAEGFEIVLSLWSARRLHRIFVKTRVSREQPRLATVSDVWPGANWCERETWEQFGIEFEGHPNLVKLLLPIEFDGNPLRKDFPLMTRELKEWPGEKEPV
jgi:NADH-quinone oxidoreductase subunit C